LLADFAPVAELLCMSLFTLDFCGHVR